MSRFVLYTGPHPWQDDISRCACSMSYKADVQLVGLCPYRTVFIKWMRDTTACLNSGNVVL
eukprot:1484900-Pyramimonas_sp.AAC.1